MKDEKYLVLEKISELIEIANKYGISTAEFWEITPRELTNRMWLHKYPKLAAK